MTKRASNLSNKRYSCKHLISTDGTKIYVKFVSHPTGPIELGVPILLLEEFMKQ
jgi:hypothetical protein